MNIRQLEKELQESYGVQDEMLSRIEELQDDLKIAAKAINRLVNDKQELEKTVQKIKAARIEIQKKATMRSIVSVN